ncbi:MAG: hypothetical protein RL227_757, partial [Pseudomonadota bacterium]
MRALEKFQLSIRQAVMLAVATAVIGPLLLLSPLDQAITRQAQVPLLEQSRRASLALTAATLVEPLWSIDAIATDRMARKALEEPAVLGLKLIENRPGTKPLLIVRNEAMLQGAIVLRTELFHEGERLGELEMHFDPKQVDRLLAERRQSSLVMAAVQTLLGLAVLTWVLYRRLARPIDKLMRQASGLATRGQGGRVAWSRQDELGELGTHLNAVHDQIDALFEQLQTQKTEIEQVALHDALTGLPNRTLFAELARSAVAA